MIGIECDRPETAARACSAALSRGIILLPSGDDGPSSPSHHRSASSAMR